MVKWSDRIANSVHKDTKCYIIRDTIKFKGTITGFCLCALHLINLSYTSNKDINAVLDKFYLEISKIMEYDRIGDENELEYLERILRNKNKKMNDIKFEITDAYNINPNVLGLVIVLDDNRGYADTFKEAIQNLDISNHRERWDDFSNMLSKYNCHIEVVVAFKQLLEKLIYFLNSTSMRTGKYEVFDKLEIENGFRWVEVTIDRLHDRMRYLKGRNVYKHEEK